MIENSVLIEEPSYYLSASPHSITHLQRLLIGVNVDIYSSSCLSIVQILIKKRWSFYALNAVKYLYRCGVKTENRVEDFTKAKNYLKLELARRRTILNRIINYYNPLSILLILELIVLINLDILAIIQDINDDTN